MVSSYRPEQKASAESFVLNQMRAGAITPKHQNISTSQEDLDLIANDDDPGFRNILRKAGLSERGFFNLALSLGGVIGALLFGLILLSLNLLNGTDTSVATASNIFALVAPFSTVAMLIFFTSRLSKLTALISNAQKTESRLDKTVEIVSLSRMLEQEAMQIEARIDKFIIVGQNLKQELRQEQTEIENAFVNKISQVKQIVSELDAERKAFFDDVHNITQALEISRDFVKSRIGTLTSEFEGAALSASQILEAKINDAANKINDVISKDFAQRDLVEKLVESNHESVRTIKEIPNAFNLHLQNAIASIHLDLEKNIDRLAVQIDTLSDSVARSNSDLTKNLSDTPLQIAHYASTLHQDLNQTLEMHSQQFISQLNNINDNVDHFIERLQSATADLPQRVEKGLEMIEPNLAITFESKINEANQKIAASMKPLLDANFAIHQTLENTPAQLDQYLNRLAPLIDARFSENAQLLENHISAVHDKQIRAGRELLGQAQSEFEAFLNEIPNFETHLSNVLSKNIQNIDEHVKAAGQTIDTLFDSHKNKIDVTNRATLEEVERAAHSQLEKINTLIEKSWTDLENTIMSSFSQQELRSKDFETSFQNLISDFKMAKNDVTGASSELGGAIQSQIKSLENSLEILLSRFNSSISANQDLAVKNISSQLTTTQQNLSQEYGLIEGRLFRSLNNFNEVVKNCITSLEEASNWRLKAFEEKIKNTSEESLEVARKEFEDLADRMRMRIDELKNSDASLLGSDMSEAKPLIDTDADTPSWVRYDTIDELSTKLETIDAILRELKSETRR